MFWYVMLCYAITLHCTVIYYYEALRKTLAHYYGLECQLKLEKEKLTTVATDAKASSPHVAGDNVGLALKLR